MAYGLYRVLFVPIGSSSTTTRFQPTPTPSAIPATVTADDGGGSRGGAPVNAGAVAGSPIQCLPVDSSTNSYYIEPRPNSVYIVIDGFGYTCPRPP